MHVLIIKNIFSEGPGTIADHLKTGNIPFTTVELSAGDALPDIVSFSHVVILGGPMAVYEMHKHEYLIREALLIDRAIRLHKHVLGVCLGAQMIAHVLGAPVYPGPAKETGWDEVVLTPDGMNDAVMPFLAIPGGNIAPVFQWHGDTFDLPMGSARLAQSKLYPNQAFRYSDRVYALQFHIEVTPGIVREWLKNDAGIDMTAVERDSESIFPDYRERTGRFFRGFFGT